MTTTQTMTTDPNGAQGSQGHLTEMMGIMRKMFTEDASTLKPKAMEKRWARVDGGWVFVLLVAGKKRGKNGNPNFKVGGVFATDALAEAKARDMGIDPKDIVRWNRDTKTATGTAPTGDTFRLQTRYMEATTIPLGKAIVVGWRVYGLVLNAARLLEGGDTKVEAAKALDALFSPSFPRTVPEVSVSLGFEMISDYWDKYSQPKPTVTLGVSFTDVDKEMELLESVKSKKFAVTLPTQPAF